MDKALFVGMGGQKNSLDQMAILSNNLANINTPGFRADYEVMKSHHINGQSDGMETRVLASVGKSYTDFAKGPVFRTERDLDLAIVDKGMFAIQSKTGKEGYTRAGNFNLTPDGFLTTASGEMVMGKTGVIKLPPAERVKIGQDGTVSVKPMGEIDYVTIGQLKLVNPDLQQLEKGHDGLFYMPEGSRVESDQIVTVDAGALEGSNVNAVETLVHLIDISRQYETHTNLIKSLSEQASHSNKLLNTKA